MALGLLVSIVFRQTCDCTVHSHTLDDILDVIVIQTDLDNDHEITLNEFRNELLSLFDEDGKSLCLYSFEVPGKV